MRWLSFSRHECWLGRRRNLSDAPLFSEWDRWRRGAFVWGFSRGSESVWKSWSSRLIWVLSSPWPPRCRRQVRGLWPTTLSHTLWAERYHSRRQAAIYRPLCWDLHLATTIQACRRAIWYSWWAPMPRPAWHISPAQQPIRLAYYRCRQSWRQSYCSRFLRKQCSPVLRRLPCAPLQQSYSQATYADLCPILAGTTPRPSRSPWSVSHPSDHRRLSVWWTCGALAPGSSHQEKLRHNLPSRPDLKSAARYWEFSWTPICTALVRLSAATLGAFRPRSVDMAQETHRYWGIVSGIWKTLWGDLHSPRTPHHHHFSYSLCPRQHQRLLLLPFSMNFSVLFCCQIQASRRQVSLDLSLPD